MSTENIIKDIYPLTPIQEGILYTYLLQKDSSAYFIQFEVVISNDLNIKCLEKSLNLIVEKYDVLRTNIVYTNIKKPKQVILREKQVNINYQDISDLTPDSIKSYIDDYKKEDKKRGFNITNENLTRMSVFKIAPQKFTIIWSFHHIIVDGWSGTKILVDFFDIYKLISQNHEYNHDSGKPNSYKDYVKWLTSQDKNTALAYWADYLKDYDTPIDIPKVLQGINCQKQFELQEYMIKIDEDTTNKLVKIASGNNVTLNALLQTIWGLLLQRYNNTDDVVFGYVESVRPTNIDGIEDMVGVFMNTIPFRVKCEEDDIFIDLLKTTQRKILNSNKYGFTSLAEIQENSYLKNNLINHISVFQNYPSMQKIINPELFDLNIEKMNMFSHSNYDFAVTFVPGNKFGIMFKYNTAVYREADIKRIGDHLINTIDSIIKNPSIKVSDIDILSNEEKDLLINGLNNTKADYPKDKTICELFEEQVRLNPDSIAVQFGETELSYKQLNEKANQLGNYLKEKYQIKPDDLVGIMLNASEQVIIAILGILKSGGAYVPIDPDYPSERIQYILEDSNVKLIICNDETQNKLSHENVSLVNMADINQLSQNTNNVLLSSKPKDMVYVIYTSGSTGKPKGVMIEQKGLVNYIYWAKNFYLGNEQIDFPLYSSLSFDLTVTSIFTPLISGNKIIVYNTKDSNYNLLEPILNEDKIGIIKLTPTHLRLLNSMSFNNKNLKKFIVGGEDLKTETARTVASKFEHPVQIFNEYGPTETVVGCSIHEFNSEDNNRSSVLIGKPVSNASIYIMDKCNRIVPIGVLGELCIGGDGVARGYLNNEELTNQKFIENPYKPGERIYKSGDAARWLPDGNLEFFGRMDDQVKIRGYRIELGEIEKVLLSHENIKEAVVIAKEINNDKELIAYLVVNGNITADDLREYIGKVLPDFMVPSYFVQLQNIPLSPNGKVDKKALPDPDSQYLDSGVEFVSQQNEAEEKLTEIWKEILGRKNIGVLENFFSIGGHSLKVTELVARVQQTFNLTLSFDTVFNNPTIRGIAEYINDNLGENESDLKKITPLKQQEYYPITYEQRGIYLASQLIKLFNTPFVVKIEGDLDIDRLEHSFKKLIERHESLRTSFHVVNGEVVQKIHESVEFKLIYLEGNESEIENIAKNFISPFSLAEAPLIKVGIMKLNNNKHVLMCDLHHIIADPVSNQILRDDLIKIYQNKDLPELTIQYKDYAVWHNYQVDNVLKSEAEYWQKLYVNNMPDFNIPTDFPRPSRIDVEGELVKFKIGKELSFKLKEIAIRNDATLFMVLLSIYTLSMAKYTMGRDIVVGTAGPSRSNPELENIVGLFVNPLPLRFKVDGSASFKNFLIHCKEHILNSFKNAQYPFDKINQTLINGSDYKNPLIKTVFNFDLFDRGSEFLCGNSKITPVELNYTIAHKDLLLVGSDSDDELNFNFVYSKKLFKKSTIDKIIAYYLDIVGDICQNPDIMIDDLISKISDGNDKNDGLSIEFSF